MRAAVSVGLIGSRGWWGLTLRCEVSPASVVIQGRSAGMPVRGSRTARPACPSSLPLGYRSQRQSGSPNPMPPFAPDGTSRTLRDVVSVVEGICAVRCAIGASAPHPSTRRASSPRVGTKTPGTGQEPSARGRRLCPRLPRRCGCGSQTRRSRAE